jgi:UDP-glucose 4-epimerase
MKRIVITGSAGFIGRESVKKLSSSSEFEIYTIDLLGSGPNHFNLDIKSPQIAGKFLEIRPDVVVHLAAQVDVMASIENPVEDLTTNAIGTLNLLEASRAAGTQEFIFIGSGGAIYDSSNEMPVNEAGRILPVSPYGISKYAAESYVRILAESYGLHWTSLALSNCYGDIESHGRGVIFAFCKALTEGSSPQINGPGVTRDFIHVQDVANAIFLSIGKKLNTRINISSNTETSLFELFTEISMILNVDINPKVMRPRDGDVVQSRLDNTKAAELLGWRPEIGLHEGLRMSISGRLTQ